MNDIQQLLERQAEWQKARRYLSWPEKIRMAETMRESLVQFRSASSREMAQLANGACPQR